MMAMMARESQRRKSTPVLNSSDSQLDLTSGTPTPPAVRELPVSAVKL
jgi:hypothetical protein